MIITVAFATPRVQDLIHVHLPSGSTVADAVARSGFIAEYGLDGKTVGYAIFGRRASAGTFLADGDRVELTRPLQVDPKTARAKRAREKPMMSRARHSKRGILG